MSVTVFCGPTLGQRERAAYNDFEFRPPVRQGELFAAARGRPRVIGVIDGYFDGEPAVWHKEILWALSQGVAVFGASSMGALRAAELHPFGMRGVGAIFAAYRDGILTDDDEVALIHGPAETGYVRLSEPMVNIRATLERAVSEGIIDDETEARLIAVAKAKFYQERDWASLLAAMGREDSLTRDRLSGWLEHGRVDQKRDDALAMLEALRDFVRRGEAAGRANFCFEWTESWANAPWRLEAGSEVSSSAEIDASVLDELRLQGSYREVRREALLRALVNERIRPEAVTPDRSEVAREMAAFRTGRSLFRQSEVQAWCDENGIDLPRLERLMAERAAVETFEREHDAALHGAMLDRLRELDLYTVLRDRALAKSKADGTRPKLPRALLAARYFEKQLGVAVPEELAEYAISIGIEDVGKFYDLIAAEFAFVESPVPERITLE
jgi:hypothetical protein